MPNDAAKLALEVKTGRKKIEAIEPKMKRHVAALSRQVPADTLKAMAEKPQNVVKHRGFQITKARQVRST